MRISGFWKVFRYSQIPIEKQLKEKKDMAVDKKDYIGKRMTVDEIKRLFPDKHAILKDYTKTLGNFVVEGILVEVLDFDDMLKYMEEHIDEKLYEFRTTEDRMNMGGYIHGELVRV
jgi:hypothetical protein